MMVVVGVVLLVVLPLVLLLSGSGSMESERFKRRYPHSYALNQRAKKAEQQRKADDERPYQ